jgi:hypothetical protein
MHRFQDTFQPVQRADHCQDMGGISPLGATGFDPAPRFAGGQEGIEEPLAARMGQHATAKIVQQREVEAGIRQFQAEGILPIHAAAHSIGGLAIGEPFDVLHHYHQR